MHIHQIIRNELQSAPCAFTHRSTNSAIKKHVVFFEIQVQINYFCILIQRPMPKSVTGPQRNGREQNMNVRIECHATITTLSDEFFEK